MRGGEEDVEREHGGLRVLGRATVQGVTVGIHYLTVYCHSCGLRFCSGHEYRGITLLGYMCIKGGEAGEMQYPLFKNTFVEKSETWDAFSSTCNGNAMVQSLFKFIHKRNSIFFFLSDGDSLRCVSSLCKNSYYKC